MKLEHTPGPWLVGSYYDGVVFGGDAYAVARMVEPIDRPNAARRAKANAHLIAAAPELLEALEYVLETHIATGNDGEDAAQKARAAITKAVTPTQ